MGPQPSTLLTHTQAFTGTGDNLFWPVQKKKYVQELGSERSAVSSIKSSRTPILKLLVSPRTLNRDRRAGYSACGRLVGLLAAPLINGLFPYRVEPGAQYRILPNCGPPRFFCNTAFGVRHALYYKKRRQRESVYEKRAGGNESALGASLVHGSLHQCTTARLAKGAIQSVRETPSPMS